MSRYLGRVAWRVLFLVALITATGCHISDYSLITDNNQTSAGGGPGEIRDTRLEIDRVEADSERLVAEIAGLEDRRATADAGCLTPSYQGGCYGKRFVRSNPRTLDHPWNQGHQLHLVRYIVCSL